MGKKKITILSIIIIIVGLSGFYLVDKITKNEYNKTYSATADSIKFKTEYEMLNSSSDTGNANVEVSIPEANPIVYSSLTEVIEILEEGTGIIYFGFPTCPWCRNAVPVLLDSAMENKIEKIYYLNPKEYRGTDNPDYNRLLEILDPYLDKNEDGVKTLYVPDVYFVKDGKIVGNNLGTLDSQKDANVPLTKEQRKELYTIYNDFINHLKI